MKFKWTLYFINFQIPTNLNLAYCYMKLEDFKSALSFADTVIQLD